MKTKFKKYENGASLAYAKNNISKTTRVEVSFNCGSRCDTIPGLAHFTEHMFFTGAGKLDRKATMKKYFDFIDVNAFTSSVNICFNGNIFTNELADYLSTVVMLINETKASKKAVQEECKVIEQEITKSQDNFKRKAIYFNKYNLTNGEAYKNSTLGSIESINKITSKDVKNFIKKYFVKNNAFVSIVSPLSYHKVKSIVEKNLLNQLKEDKNFSPLPNFYAPVVNDKFVQVKKDDINKCYIKINFTFDKNIYDHKFKIQFDTVLRMMNDLSDGILKLIRLERSLVYSAWFEERYDEHNCVVTFASECDSKNINNLIASVSEYLNGINKFGFTKNQFEKQMREIKYMQDCGEPRSLRLMSKLDNYKYYGKIIKHSFVKKIQKHTTLDDVNKIFREFLKSCRCSMSIYGDFNQEIDKNEFEKLFKFD